MYLIPIAWLYVVILVAAAEDTIVAAVLTFVFWGLAPLALFLWLFGTPARRRRRRSRSVKHSNATIEPKLTPINSRNP